MPRQPRAFSYLRFSSKPQAKGDSKRRQLSLIGERSRGEQESTAEKWCRENGVTLDTSVTYHDYGRSAKDETNLRVGELGAFLRAIKSGHVKRGDYLLVERIDRLSRAGIKKGGRLIEEILSAGVTVVTMADRQVYRPDRENDLIQSLMVMIHLHMAWQYSKNLGDRVHGAWENKQRNADKEILTDQCPSWLVRKGDKWKQIPKEVRTLKRVFKLAETKGAMAIRTQLIKEELVPWSTAKIAKALRSRAPLGEYQPRSTRDESGERLPGNKRRDVGDPSLNYYPKLVTEAAWERVNARLDSRKVKRLVGSDGVNNLFTGLIFAGGEKVTYYASGDQTHKRDRLGYLKIHSKSSKFECPSLPYDLVEATVRAWAADLTLSEVGDSREGLLDDKVARLSAKLESLSDQIINHPSETLARSIAKVESDYEEALEQLTQLRRSTSPRASLEKVQGALSANDTKTRARLRESLARLVDRIEILWCFREWKAYRFEMLIALSNEEQRQVTVDGLRVIFGSLNGKKLTAKGSKELNSLERVVELEDPHLQIYHEHDWHHWYGVYIRGEMTVVEIAKKLACGKSTLFKKFRTLQGR